MKIRARWLSGVALAVLCLSEAVPVQAAELKDFITNLWPGGILLSNVGASPGVPFHAPHFLSSSQAGLSALSSALTTDITAFPFTSSAGGVTYDFERGIPIATPESLGPVLGERADTLGKGRLNIAVSYSHADFSSFQGTPLDQEVLFFAHQRVRGCPPVAQSAGTACDFQLDQIKANLNIQLTQDVVALGVTYGLADNWDVGIVLPLVHVWAFATADGTVIHNAVISPDLHNFGPGASPSHTSSGGESYGVGDLMLRTKYSMWRNDPELPDLSFIGQIQAPTGDVANLLGTGSTDILGLAVLSKQYGWFAPHVNLGYQVAIAGLDRNQLRYAVGADFRAAQSLSVSGDFVGRWRQGATAIGANTTDFAVGARWNAIGASVIDALMIFPVNQDSGLRPDYAFMVGFEQTF